VGKPRAVPWARLCVTVDSVVLLSQYIRASAITGRSDTLNASWFAGRQGGRWAEQTVQAAMPQRAHIRPRPAPEQSDPSEALRKLEELHAGGVLTDAELDTMRARLGG
jgi:putative oligomerization/nucleic acid binding protein